MLVFGDRVRSYDPWEALPNLADRLAELANAPPGIARHGRLVSLFIEASELVQGIADAEFEKRGCDTASETQEAAMSVLAALGRAIQRSWDSGFDQRLALPVDTVRRLAGQGLPDRIKVKSGEGYAFYALYPEAYAAAASALDRSAATKVIGIRSIGTGLAAMVAAAVDAEPPVTVRPVGHPFDRRVALSNDLAHRLLNNSAARFAIVDEGPGLSGSSLGAVADYLEEQGVSAERIHFFPSHAGDLGPEASPRHRQRWARAKRHVVDFDALVLRAAAPAHGLKSWVADLGEARQPIRDISGGAWRNLCFGSERDWPAAQVQQERRKFLLQTESGPWLLKFAGLGPKGERKLERGRWLCAAGFVPEVRGYRHGFLIERWISSARPLNVSDVDRAALVEHVGRYLAFRAANFGAEPASGASLRELFDMARYNAARELGDNLARRLDPWASRIASMQSRVRLVETDNRMHAWEWRVVPGSGILKTDALDHHDAHDLVGCQDVAWDIVGAAVELGLSSGERDDLCTVVERLSGRDRDPELLAFLTPCYLAFQLGYYRLGATAVSDWPEETARLGAAGDSYAGRLRRVLTAPD